MKICRKCGKELPLTDFYTHKRMADGHLNICKDCVKTRVTKYRYENLDKVHEYDKTRSQSNKRKNLRAKITKKRRKEVGYQKAHSQLERNVKNGKIIKPKTCQCCGKETKLEAHHMDYSRELDVIWLCAKCHSKVHVELRRAEREK